MMAAMVMMMEVDHGGGDGKGGVVGGHGGD